MDTTVLAPVLAHIFRELTDGTSPEGGFVLNRGDSGLLASLDKLTAVDASRSTQGGATIAAHTAHLSFGLSLMDRWATEGGNPFTNARWQDAWTIGVVDEARWKEIRDELRDQVQRWDRALRQPREVIAVELSGMIGSVAHLAYHLGAIRQIHAGARGPKDSTGE